MLLVSRVLCSASSALRGPRSSEDSEMFTHAACLLLRREVLDALAKPTEIARPLACPSFGWARGTITLEPVERLGLLQDYRRFPPAEKFSGCIRMMPGTPRDLACEAEEKIQVGMVPTHVQLPLELAPPKGGERPAALRPRNGDSASWQRQRNCAALPSLVSRRNPRAGLVASRQTFVRRCHLLAEP